MLSTTVKLRHVKSLVFTAALTPTLHTMCFLSPPQTVKIRILFTFKTGFRLEIPITSFLNLWTKPLLFKVDSRCAKLR